MATVRETVYQLLRQHGLTTIFGNPGSNELPFLADFPSDFRYFLALHEGVAIGMADGYAQASGMPALVNLHAAAGSGNGMGGLANAQAAHSPLIVTAGQQVRDTVGVEPLLTNVDAGQLPRPLVKWSYEPASAQDVPRAFAQAVFTAMLPPRGPVYLSVPYDDWSASVAGDLEVILARKVSGETTLPDAVIAALLRRLVSARSPVLVLGSDVDAAAGEADAVLLAEKQNLPVWVAPSSGRCPFPTKHPHFRGKLTAGVASLARELHEHDLVLVIGAPVFRYHQFEPGEFLAAGTTLLHLTSDPAEAARAPFGEAFVADIGPTLRLIAERSAKTERPAITASARVASAPLGKGILSPESVFDLIAEVAPSDAIYVDESPSTTDAMWERVPMEASSSYFFPGAGGLGFGIPAALGVQLALPQRRVIAVIGDGSANYAITGLWTAAQHRIPVIFIILKNGVYGALEWFAKVLHAENVPGLRVPAIDFCSLAKAYGVDAAHRANTIEELHSALQMALKQTCPVLIEVETLFRI